MPRPGGSAPGADRAATGRCRQDHMRAPLASTADRNGRTWQAVPMASSDLHDAMAARVERGEFPGIVMLVARGDEVWADAIGTTFFGGEVPMRRDTVFRIASLTKPVVAAATMILAEDDVLDLEEPVHRLL